MKLTLKIWNEKGYVYLGKTSQNLRDQYANLMRKTNTNAQPITNELNEQRPNEPEHEQQRQTQPGKCECTEARDSAITDRYTDLLNHATTTFLEGKEQGLKKEEANNIHKEMPEQG